MDPFNLKLFEDTMLVQHDKDMRRVCDFDPAIEEPIDPGSDVGLDAEAADFELETLEDLEP
jgi:hypothetical protein